MSVEPGTLSVSNRTLSHYTKNAAGGPKIKPFMKAAGALCLNCAVYQNPQRDKNCFSCFSINNVNFGKRSRGVRVRSFFFVFYNFEAVISNQDFYFFIRTFAAKTEVCGEAKSWLETIWRAPVNQFTFHFKASIRILVPWLTLLP